MSAFRSDRGSPAKPPARLLGLLSLALGLMLGGEARADDEALIFTPAGFDRPGSPATSAGETSARLEIVVLDGVRGRPTPCRVNVVGADGQFYQPAEDP